VASTILICLAIVALGRFFAIVSLTFAVGGVRARIEKLRRGFLLVGRF